MQFVIPIIENILYYCLIVVTFCVLSFNMYVYGWDYAKDTKIFMHF